MSELTWPSDKLSPEQQARAIAVMAAATAGDSRSASSIVHTAEKLARFILSGR